MHRIKKQNLMASAGSCAPFQPLLPLTQKSTVLTFVWTLMCLKSPLVTGDNLNVGHMSNSSFCLLDCLTWHLALVK